MSTDRNPELTAAVSTTAQFRPVIKTLTHPVFQADAIFDDLLADLILSCTISAHREIKRGRAICGVCGTRRVSHPIFGQLSSESESHTYTH
jgi:hypothetical protein